MNFRFAFGLPVHTTVYLFFGPWNAGERNVALFSVLPTYLAFNLFGSHTRRSLAMILPSLACITPPTAGRHVGMNVGDLSIQNLNGSGYLCIIRSEYASQTYTVQRLQCVYQATNATHTYAKLRRLSRLKKPPTSHIFIWLGYKTVQEYSSQAAGQWIQCRRCQMNQRNRK